MFTSKRRVFGLLFASAFMVIGLIFVMIVLPLLYVPPVQTLNPADVIVVLGHPANPDGTPSRSMQEEVSLATQLYQEGLAGNVLFSGGAVLNSHVEADVMAAVAEASGLPRVAVVIEANAKDTIQNAVYTKEIMLNRGWTDAIVVTTPYHARRASFVFDEYGIRHQLAFETQSYQTQDIPSRIGAFIYELAGIAWMLLSRLFGLSPFWSKQVSNSHCST